MALRVVLNRTKPWGPWGCCGYQLVKGKFGSFGAVRSNRSIVDQNLLFNFNTRLLPLSFNQSCRHYFLPPPPQVSTLCRRPFFGQRQCGVFTLFDQEAALEAVRFALTMHNDTEGTNIQFRRVVRASSRSCPPIELEYYVTFEGIDENGDLNVYYVDVVYKPFCVERGLLRPEHGWTLIKFLLVDESFSYPFIEQRWSEQILEWMERKFGMNEALGDWLHGIALQYKDDKTFVESISGPCTENSNVLEKIMNFEKNVLHIPDDPLTSNDDMDAVHVMANDEVVPIYNIMDYHSVIDYASAAVEIYNNKEGKRICLEEVVCARKAEASGKIFYFLLLEAQDEKIDLNFYYAVIKVLPSAEVELIRWHVVDELFSGPLQKDQWEECRLLLEKSMKFPLCSRQERIEAEQLRGSLMGW